MSDFKVRTAQMQDVPALIELARQLGYEAGPEGLQQRLAHMLADGDHEVFVAEAGWQVVGWVHPYIVPLLEVSLCVEIGGLVVDQDWRGRGVGRGLMEAAEGWARTKGVNAVSLRSNTIREDAHRFYEGLGYRVIKQQKAFLKILPPEQDGPGSPAGPGSS